MQVFLHLEGKKIPYAYKISRLFSKLLKKKIGAGSSLNRCIESFDVCSPLLDNPEIILRVTKGVSSLGMMPCCIDVYFFLKAELVQRSCINDSFSLT